MTKNAVHAERVRIASRLQQLILGRDSAVPVSVLQDLVDELMGVPASAKENVSMLDLQDAEYKELVDRIAGAIDAYMRSYITGATLRASSTPKSTEFHIACSSKVVVVTVTEDQHVCIYIRQDDVASSRHIGNSDDSWVEPLRSAIFWLME